MVPPNLRANIIFFCCYLLWSAVVLEAAQQQGLRRQQPSSSAGIAFASWYKANINAPKCAVHSFDGGRGGANRLRGIIALDDISAGETVMEVPLALCFQAESVAGEDQKWPCELAMSILSELNKGDESKWWPYLQQLPTAREFDVMLPLHWSADEIEETFSQQDFIFDDDVKLAVENSWAFRDLIWSEVKYRNRALWDKASRRDVVVERLAGGRVGNAIVDASAAIPLGRTSLNTVNSLITSSRAAAFSGDGGKDKETDKEKEKEKDLLFTRRDFEYALDLVQTRNCCPSADEDDPIEGSSAKFLHLVVPLFDFLNHDASADTVISIDDDKKTVRLTTLKDIPKSSQVFLNYHLESQMHALSRSPAKAPEQAEFVMDFAAYALTSYGFIPPLDDVNVLLPLDTIRSMLVEASTAILLQSAPDEDADADSGNEEGARPGSALSLLQSLGIQISQPFLVYRDGISTSLLAVYRVLAMDEAARTSLWSQGPEAVRGRLLGLEPLNGDVKAGLAALLADERRKHRACVLGAGAGAGADADANAVAVDDDTDDEDRDAVVVSAGLGEESLIPQGASRRASDARRRYSRLSLEVLDDCVTWLESLPS